MAAFAQILVLPFLLAPAMGYPHPYPWLQAIIQNPQPQYYETYPYSSLDLQNNPFLSGMFHNPAMFVPDESFIIGQLPFDIHGHPMYVNDPYFTGFSPQDIDWDKAPEVPGDGDFDNNFGSDKPDVYDSQHGNNGGENVGDSINQGNSNSPYGYDEDPKVNENQIGAGGSSPQEADEELPIDPRKDEAKYDKPH